MALNASYAFRASSFSALLTGAGFAILLAKFSASFPLKTGVSLMGRAMFVLFVIYRLWQRYNKNQYDVWDWNKSLHRPENLGTFLRDILLHANSIHYLSAQ